jgi:hypothetical protein
MFWHKTPQSAPSVGQIAAVTPAPIDPAIEAQRVTKLTANKDVIIQRDEGSHIKLPGL